MFRKEQQLVERSRTPLKNKEVKKLKADLLQHFPLLNPERLDQLLPNKVQVVCIKLANRTTIFCLSGEGAELTPLFFDVEGRGNFYPTVYALWHLPDMVRAVNVHPPVSEFIFNGADLMLPGVVGELSPVLRGEKRCVIARGNPKAFAVGDMLIDDQHLAINGKKGKGLRVVHSFGDLLWAMGDRMFPEGFTVSGVERIAQPAPSAERGESDEEKEEASGEGEDDLERKVPEDSGADEMQEMTEGVEEGGDRDFDAAMAALDIGAEQEGGAEGEAGVEEKEEITGTDEAAAMDELIVTTFLRAAKYVVKDRQLPMLASTFYASYMLPARPEGSVIDLKKSSFKKVTAFLEEMARRRLIMLQNNNGVVSITSINREAPDYRMFRTDDAEAIRAAVDDAHGSGKKEEVAHQYRVFELFRLPRPMRDAFGDAHGQYGEYLSAQEAKSIVMTYVAANSLENPTNKRMVRLDPLLSHLLFKKQKGSKQERRAAERERQGRPMTEEDFPELGTEPTDRGADEAADFVTKEELMTTFMGKLSKYHAIESDAFPEGIRIDSGPAPTIDMLIEARQGNKVVTRVTGLEAFGITPDQFAKDCQKRFACSATVNQITGQKQKEVTIQGHLAQELEGWLPTRYGLPARFVSTTVRKGVKPKKKAR